jgi:3-oxoacyl-[acyl-carrier protein] reductase
MDKITFDFRNRTALVTGGAQGFGLDIAKRFLKSGAKVIIWDIDSKMLEKVIKEINNPNLSSNIVDVSNYQDVEKCVTNITKNSNIDILVNNAGITGPTAALWEYDVEMWKKVVNINLLGTFNCCRTIVPNMIKNNYGRIVNVASVAGKDGNANASAYSVGKAGAIGLTKSLGKELADKNIAVNAITPAGANTRILDQMTKEHVQRMLSKVPRGRFLEVEEFTSLVCWLSSEENTFSTAAVFDISGGRSTY